MMTNYSVLSLVALALSLAACATSAVPGDAMNRPVTAEGRCNAQPAQVLIGERASAETGQRALDLTGARILRWGPPGAMFTMDYREDRVSVLYDENMSVTEIRCG